MANRRAERLVNLAICLLAASEEVNRRAKTRQYVTREYIRNHVEGYDKEDVERFRVMFERDKADLRNLGIPIEQGPAGAPGEQQGYFVSRSALELPEIDFTPEEQEILGVATKVWRDGVMTEQTAVALAKLRTIGIEPGTEVLELFAGQIEVDEPAFEALSEAATTSRTASFRYRGEKRILDPWSLVSRFGSWYVVGFDRGQQAPRIYKLDRIDGKVTVSQTTFLAPDPAAVAKVVAEISPKQREVTVAIRDGAALGLARRGRPVAAAAPEGFSAYRVTIPDWLGGIGELASYGAELIVLEPTEVRDAVIEQLRGVAHV